ncbi:MAG: GntR family transcriptional regulator [Planctomycetaceae bacterium]|nr:GntR family transcriptional regulator [Planctomycetales bacterium]MCB9927606.1 GntR family transcriptional regulator [Planctomycetaceae bacterium]
MSVTAKETEAIGKRREAATTKSLLKDRAYAELKRLILNTTFSPGDFLSERQLAERLTMSKTPVKAALQRLESEGFIAVSPQQGIVVRELSIHEIADQFEIRLALESHVLRMVAGKLTDDEGTRLTNNLAQQRSMVATHDYSQAVQLDTEFHMMICEFHGNREFMRVMLQLRERMHRVIARVLEQDRDRNAASVEEHAAIAEAILAGDADRAAGCLKEHLEYGKQFLLTPRRR